MRQWSRHPHPKAEPDDVQIIGDGVEVAAQESPLLVDRKPGHSLGELGAGRNARNDFVAGANEENVTVHDLISMGCQSVQNTNRP